MSSDEEKQTLLQIVSELYDRYQSDEYMRNRVTALVGEQLPQLLANAEKNKIDRDHRKKVLTENMESFITKFLNENIYLYSNTASAFFQYDKSHYYMYSEDDIIHEILRSITQKPDLHPWKHKIKVQLLKSIKDRPLWGCIPESATIQFVHKLLCPVVFPNKVYTKHFLCVIGDCLRRKNDNNVCLISSSARFLIRYLSEFGTALFGHNSIASTFKYKYYDHTFGDCRLIRVQSRIDDLEKEVKKNILDILCVSYYYSQRYGSADAFIHDYKSTDEGKYVLFLSHRSSESLVKEFVDCTITRTKQADTTISLKMMNYLWKNYLHKIDIPNVLFASQLKASLESCFKYDESQEAFLNVTSNYLPSVQSFLQFWGESVEVVSSDIEELEIEELLIHLRKFNSKVFGTLQTNDLLAIITHFFPEVSIEDDKYISNISLKVWDKHKEVSDFLVILKETSNNEDMSIDKAYEKYARRKSPNQVIVGKRYFTKHLIETLGDFIFDDRYILQSWFV